MTFTYDKPIKLIALDIDGTILNSNLELSERNKRALIAASEQGIQVVLATGKTRTAGRYLIDALNLTTPGIFLQGCAIYNADGTIRQQFTLDPAIVRQVLTYGEDRGFTFMTYSGTRIFVRKRDPEVTDGVRRYHEPEAEIVGAMQNLAGEVPINKLMAIGEARGIKALRYQLEAQLRGSARVLQAGISTMVEILPPGISKGAALKVLAKQLDIPAENVMAMGDAENDIESLQFAGLGVAVGNAEAHLKAVAKTVVGTNDEDGVAEAIERFILKREIKAPDSAEKMIETPPDIKEAEPVNVEVSSEANE